MSIKHSDLKSVLAKETFLYNFLLYSYLTFFLFVTTLLIKYNFLNLETELFYDIEKLVLYSSLWKLILSFSLIPCLLTFVVGPLVLLATHAILELPHFLLLAPLYLLFLPFNIVCCLFIFIGSFFHFFISLLFNKLKFVEDPHLFLWVCYIFIMKPEVVES